jgi:hypothetical protein
MQIGEDNSGCRRSIPARHAQDRAGNDSDDLAGDAAGVGA